MMTVFTELVEAGCGATDENFCFPTFVVERKSNCGSLYQAENQLGRRSYPIETPEYQANRITNHDKVTREIHPWFSS